MLQQEKAEDFVLATGETTTVRSFVELAFKEVGIEIVWEGKGVHEKGKDRNTGKVIVEVSPDFFRPAEVDLLIGDASKAKNQLKWNPKTRIEALVRLMVRSDIQSLEGDEKNWSDYELESLLSHS